MGFVCAPFICVVLYLLLSVSSGYTRSRLCPDLVPNQTPIAAHAYHAWWSVQTRICKTNAWCLLLPTMFSLKRVVIPSAGIRKRLTLDTSPWFFYNRRQNIVWTSCGRCLIEWYTMSNCLVSCSDVCVTKKAQGWSPKGSAVPLSLLRHSSGDIYRLHLWSHTLGLHLSPPEITLKEMENVIKEGERGLR